ncbi:hypothetical protein ACFVH6_32330 [Spirillospora sp. NPDC127200]
MAEVSGLGHPVSGGGALPGDRDVDVDAEHAGQQAGGKFGGELEQRDGAGLAGLETEVFETLSVVGALPADGRGEIGEAFPSGPSDESARVVADALEDDLVLLVGGRAAVVTGVDTAEPRGATRWRLAPISR